MTELSIPFTLATLRAMATPNSFERGREYYEEHAVRNLVYTGKGFEARVLGSYVYQVKISGTPSAPKFHCTCPYEYGGICKHCVAVGLAILDKKLDTITADYEDAEIIDSEADAHFDHWFAQVPDEDKVRFLQQLLEKDHTLRNQFLRFGGVDTASPASQQTSPPPDADATIERIREEVASELASLCFDDRIFYRDYDAYNGYYDEWDAAYDNSRTMIREVLEKYLNHASFHFRQGALVSGLQFILGMYEAIFEVEEPASDDHYIFDDTYQETVKEVFQESVDDVFLELQQVVKSASASKHAIDLILQRYHFYASHGSNHADDELMPDAYDLKDFEAFFLSLLNDGETAAYLLEHLQAEHLVNQSTAFVLLRIAEVQKDESLWLTTAGQFAEDEKDIMQRLLDRYRLANRTDDFLRTARSAFQHFPVFFDEYLVQHLVPEQDIRFYKQLLIYMTKRTHRVDHYRMMRPFLTPEEISRFIADIGKTYNHVFYVQILEIEKRYDNILERVRQCISNDDELDQLIAPIINIHHEACFTLLQKKCRKALEYDHRNRHTYQTIVKWLQLMSEIDGFEDQTRELIEELYHHQPHLPALKDEFRKAKLV